MCKCYRPLQYVGIRGLNKHTVKAFFLNPQIQKVYMTRHKAMTIVKLVGISVQISINTPKS